ncbi:MAG: PAS domain S-box protein, partial [bacterium]|nr:PAS domain S-box protein [bacterium]
MEDLYRRLLEFSQAGIYQYSFETGKIIFANQGLVDILGLNCAPEDLEGDYLKNLLIYVEEEASIRSLLDKHGEIHDHEYNFKTLNGEDRWVIHNSILTLDPDTGEKTVEAIVKDITERKKIEKKLKHIDTVLRAVNNITQFIVREKDRKRLLEQICKYLIEIPNYTHSWIAIKGSSGELEAWAEAGIGKSFKALSRKLKKGDQPSCVTEAMKQSTSIHVNHPSESCSGCPLADTFSEHSVIVSRLEHSDRIFGTLAVSISQTFISNHEDIELLEEIARDIGLALHDIELEYERAQAEEEIRKERDKAQKYLDVAGVIILALDTDQNVTLINNKGCEILECPEDEIIGKNWFNNFIPKRLQKEVKHVFTRLMSGDIEPTEYFENLILTETGEERTIAWHNTMLTDKNGTITGALASGTDITQRKVAEKALRESETRLQQVTDHARAWVWEVDTVGVYTYASPAVKTILGFDPEELIGKKHFFDLFSPDTREELTRKTFEVFQKKETFREFSNLNIHKKGHEVWLSTNGFPLLDNDGELIGYRGSDTDVTEKRKTGKALKESERRYRRITEAVTDYIFTVFVVAGHPVKTVHGEACVAVTGYTTEEFENNPFLWIAMVPEEDRPKVKKQAASVMKGVEPKPLEHRIIRKDGQIRWVRNKLVPHYDIRGNLLSYDGLIRDVSERKRTEEALIESEEQYRCLFEYSLEGICLSKGNRILSANKALLDIFGYDSPDTFMDIPLIEHIAPEAKKLFIQLVKKREPGKKLSDKFETKILRKESEIRDVAIATTEVVIDNELCILGTFRDITVRKIAERALQESEKKYRAIFEQAADSIVLVDSETGELAAFNKRAHKALGYTRREFKKLTLRDIEFIESPGEIKQHLKYVVEKKADLFETMHRTKKGYIRDILVNARSLSIEGRNYIQAIWIDITDRKKAEKQLRESQERYRRLFEYSPISLWEEDFSLYKAWIDKMKDSGITNFRNYFKKHPEAIEQCSRLVQIVDVNQATLDLYQAKNKEEVTSNLAGIFTEESYNVFTEELMALAEGDLEFSSEAVTRTLEG